MNSNKIMNTAKKVRNDEFYTLLEDIQSELSHYKHHFKDKVVYMNADHPDYSKFWEYFKVNFESLELRKIVSTFHWDAPFKTTYDGVAEVRVPLEGDGDFRSDECVEILKESDIIVTNPPFSLFRDLIKLIIDNDKKFLVIGNNNAVTYKEIFPHIMNNEMWLGTKSNVYMFFKAPEGYEISRGKVGSDGSEYVRVPALSWFTNLEHDKRYEGVQLVASYEGSEHEFPKYDNYDAINVDKVRYIPKDYKGVMGVPITFVGKWNPEQFEIVGATESEGKGCSGGLWDANSGVPHPMVDGKRKYKRIFIKRRDNDE